MLSVYNEICEKYQCFIVAVNDVERAVESINASQALYCNNLYYQHFVLADPVTYAALAMIFSKINAILKNYKVPIVFRSTFFLNRFKDKYYVCDHKGL